MSLKGVIQGLDENGDPKQVMLSTAAAAAVERLITLMSEHQGGPYLLQNGLAYLRKYNDFPCPFPVTVDFSPRHFAEMIVSILLLHGYDRTASTPLSCKSCTTGPAGCAHPTRTASLTH